MPLRPGPQRLLCYEVLPTKDLGFSVPGAGAAGALPTLSQSLPVPALSWVLLIPP